MDRIKLFALMFLLPLALAVVGGWELQRVRAESAATAATNPDVQAEIAELQEMQRRVMADMHVTIEVNGKHYGYQAAHGVLQTRIDKLTGNAWVYQKAGPKVVTAFSVLALVGGIGGVLLGVSGVAWATAAGRVARRSRDELVRVFSTSRDLLPFLLIGTLLLTVLALLRVTGAEGWRVVERIATGNPSKGEMKLYIVLLVVGAVSVWMGGAALVHLRSAFTAFAIGPMDQQGRAVTRAEAPGLWRHVESIATSVRARPPQNIVVGLTDGFYATAHEVVLQPAQHKLTGETLYVPLTHTALLRPDEFSAIIGHELGHFAGEDTAYTRRFVPMWVGMQRSLDLLAEQAHWTVTPARLLGEYLMAQVRDAERHWSREREFAADAVGMHVAGSRASARALVRIQAAAPAADRFVDDAMGKPELAPGDLVDALVVHVRTHGLPVDDINLDHALPHPTDTHPPTLARLKALGETVDDRLFAEATEAVDLRGIELLESFFTDRRALTAALTADLASVSIAWREAARAELSSMAAEAEPPSTVEENAAISFVVLLVFAIGFIGGALFMVGLKVPPGGDTMKWRVAAGLALAALPFAWGALMFRRRGQRPVLSLTPTGFGGDGFIVEVPWADVFDVHMAVGQGCLITFSLNPDAPLPVLRDGNLRRIKVKAKQRQVLVQMTRVRGMTYQQLLDKLVRYRRAEYARRTLETF